MASNSTLDPENFPAQDRPREQTKGHGVRSLGPGDSSDTGSDLAGARPNRSDEISLERGADEDSAQSSARDVTTDRVVRADEAGLGGGLDQAEEARLGVKDESGGASRTDK